jgi:NTP pyrophosphatase (non-canonical NTP hydrolase)
MKDETFYSAYVEKMFKSEADGFADQQVYLDNYGLLHAAVGLAGEAGEVLDQIKKSTFTNKKEDLHKLVQEMGDVEFYMQALRNELAISRDHVLNENILKLEARHPDGFSKSDYYKEIHG